MKQRKTLFQAIFFSVVLTAVVMLPLSAFFYWFSGYFDSIISGENDASIQAAAYLEQAALVLFASASLILLGAFLRLKKIVWGKWIMITGSLLLTIACLIPVYQITQSTSEQSISSMAVALWFLFSTPHVLLIVFLPRQDG